MDSLTVPQLKKLIHDQGLQIPVTGSGKNGTILKKDLIDLLSGGVRSGSITESRSRSDISNYDLIKELGKGQYGNVYLAQNKETGGHFAIKEIDIDHLDSAKREYQVTKNFGCLSRVLCYKDFIISGDNAYLIMDYLPGEDLIDLIENRMQAKLKFSPQELLIMFEQMLIGLDALHSHKIAHMDIKVENIRSTVGGLFLIDLGMACTAVGECNITQSPGTKEVWSPEMSYAFTLNKPKMTSAEYLASDVWAMGLVFRSLVSLKVYDMEDVRKQITRYPISREDHLKLWAETNYIRPCSTTCAELNGLVDDMLKLKYTERPSARELLNRIRKIKC